MFDIAIALVEQIAKGALRGNAKPAKNGMRIFGEAILQRDFVSHRRKLTGRELLVDFFAQRF